MRIRPDEDEQVRNPEKWGRVYDVIDTKHKTVCVTPDASLAGWFARLRHVGPSYGYVRRWVQK